MMLKIPRIAMQVVFCVYCFISADCSAKDKNSVKSVFLLKDGKVWSRSRKFFVDNNVETARKRMV